MRDTYENVWKHKFLFKFEMLRSIDIHYQHNNLSWLGSQILIFKVNFIKKIYNGTGNEWTDHNTAHTTQFTMLPCWDYRGILSCGQTMLWIYKAEYVKFFSSSSIGRWWLNLIYPEREFCEYIRLWFPPGLDRCFLGLQRTS